MSPWLFVRSLLIVCLENNLDSAVLRCHFCLTTLFSLTSIRTTYQSFKMFLLTNDVSYKNEVLVSFSLESKDATLKWLKRFVWSFCKAVLDKKFINVPNFFELLSSFRRCEYRLTGERTNIAQSTQFVIVIHIDSYYTYILIQMYQSTVNSFKE